MARKKKAGYSKTPETTQEKAYLVNNQDVRGVGEPYAIPGNFREASLPVDPLRIFGSVTTLPLAAFPVATETSKGIVELATSGENAANVVVQGNDSRINVVTTKGDLYGCSGTNTPARHAVSTNGKFLQADSTQTTGLKWNFFGGLGGAWIYGDGADGALTLVANTTLADDDNLKNYTDVTMAGYNLTFNSANYYATVYVSGTLTGGGGYIHSWGLGAAVVGAGAVAAGTASGGDGGLSSAAIYVYAKTAATVTVSANGRPGTAGTNSPAPTVTSANAAGGAATGTVIRFRGGNLGVTAQAGGGAFTAAAGVVSTGGAAGSLTAATRRKEINCSKSIMELAFPLMGEWNSTGAEMDSVTAGRSSFAAAGGGGSNGGGDHLAAYAAYCGGGGGGGGSGLHGDGGAGRDGVLAVAPSAGYALPGGGGGGGGGSEATLFTDDGSSAVAEADGGVGGDAGTGGTFSGEGAGGGGGGGGISLGIGPGVTATAAGGLKGSGGVNGGDGTAGRAYDLER